MINLRVRGLPNTIEVGGSPFSIKTDFREWLRFAEIVKEMNKYLVKDLYFLFQDKIPVQNPFLELMEFYLNKNEYPHGSGSSADTLNYEVDSEYIYSAFMQQYGIDLVDIEYLHWHKFKALLLGLTDDTLLGKVMSYRAYSGKDKELMKMRNAWSLPLTLTEDDMKQKQEFDDYFDDRRG